MVMKYKIKLHKSIKLPNDLFKILSILILITSVTYLVYITGGTKHPYTHLMYVPIIIASFFWGLRGGTFFALVGGFAVGPYMPQDVKLGAMQNASDCLYRTVFYIIVSLVVSVLMFRIKEINKGIQKSSDINPVSGMPNINKFLKDIDNIILNKTFDSFTILGFEYINMKQINRYVDYGIGRKSLQYLLDNAVENFKEFEIYSIENDEFVIILPKIDVNTALEKGKVFIEKFNHITYFNGVPVNFELNCGIVNFPQHGNDSITILRKIGRAMDQVESSNNPTVIYEDRLAEKSIENYNMLVSFNEALREDKLTLYYQPKIDLRNNKVIGVEALLRWKELNNKNVSISKLISIVEDAGFITELTKWVIKISVNQLKEWCDMGLDISVSVNLSSKDLDDRTIIDYTKEIIEKCGVDPTYFEYELTERTLIENDEKGVGLLNELRDMGIKISIDDYGIGYNSLMNMVNLPFECIKIDKYFIDNFVNYQGVKLVEDIVRLIHNLGKEVCAEGVETKEQLNILTEMGCDYVQGYYFSKAIPPKELEQFLLNRKL